MSDQSHPLDDLSRKDFLRAAILTTGSAVAAVGATGIARVRKTENDPTGDSTKVKLNGFKDASLSKKNGTLIRMQEDLRRAMAKPVEKRKWGMIIDQKRCVGCHACTIACKAENKLPPGVVYRPVITQTKGKFPEIKMSFIPRPCMQCDNPSCIEVCPVKATWKRPDGIVSIDYNKCIGCRYCLSACPYGARTSDQGLNYTDGTPEVQPYEKVSGQEYGKKWDRAGNGSPAGNARKCHFCLHRLEKGLLPMCVTTCISNANYFGDMNDKESLIYEISKQSNQVKLLEEKGTEPFVSYLL
jgi:Fe-S-cluster-containing dehydrogenase component